MSERDTTVALLVVAEHDIDSAAAFRSATGLSPRYYAPIHHGPVAAAAGSTEAAIAVVEAAGAEEAIQLVMERNPGIPLLVMSAGEILVRGASHDGPSPGLARERAGAGGNAASSKRRIPSRIRVAGGWTRHGPWFDTMRAHVRVPLSYRGPLPELAVERRPADLSAALAAATRTGLERSQSPGSPRTLNILFAPAIASLRVYCDGAWRDGARGFLLASLHGLSALVTVARHSLAGSLPAASPASLEKGSRS